MGWHSSRQQNLVGLEHMPHKPTYCVLHRKSYILKAKMAFKGVLSEVVMGPQTVHKDQVLVGHLEPDDFRDICFSMKEELRPSPCPLPCE